MAKARTFGNAAVVETVEVEAAPEEKVWPFKEKQGDLSEATPEVFPAKLLDLSAVVEKQEADKPRRTRAPNKPKVAGATKNVAGGVRGVLMGDFMTAVGSVEQAEGKAHLMSALDELEVRIAILRSVLGTS